MSFSNVRPFFRTRLEALGYTEHTDAIDFQNIPSTILDDTFQLETDTIAGGSANQRAHDFDYSVTLRVFKRGFSNPVNASDDLDTIIETILTDLLDPANRLGVNIKDIVPTNITKNELSNSDDNDFFIEFNFDVRLILCF